MTDFKRCSHSRDQGRCDWKAKRWPTVVHVCVCVCVHAFFSRYLCLQLRFTLKHLWFFLKVVMLLIQHKLTLLNSSVVVIDTDRLHWTIYWYFSTETHAVEYKYAHRIGIWMAQFSHLPAVLPCADDSAQLPERISKGKMGKEARMICIKNACWHFRLAVGLKQGW